MKHWPTILPVASGGNGVYPEYRRVGHGYDVRSGESIRDGALVHWLLPGAFFMVP